MEKSIESIWKEGFLKNNALVAPKLNNLYNQKSIHFVDAYARRFKMNMIAIIIGSLLFLAFSFLFDIPIMGIGFVLILNTLVVVDRKLLLELKLINKSDTSYQYLKSFENWLKKKHHINRKMATLYYPLFFIFTVLGFWFSSNFHNTIEKIFGVNGFELFSIYWFIPILIFIALLGFFGGRLYDWDVRMVYGSMYDKLEELIKDMETLRDEDYTEDDLVSGSL